MDYNNKRFRVLRNTKNGETNTDTIFHYKQEKHILTSTYSGGKITKGHLIGLVDENGNIDMRYHQINTDGQLMTGICSSKPEFLSNGKVRLHESWEWTSGNKSKGSSVLEEVD